ncbi:MAG: hypothetical protein HY331_16765 [Chloroflexi bacterium]|nr:hypothetical protein [Chloroflexota bacterium]
MVDQLNGKPRPSEAPGRATVDRADERPHVAIRLLLALMTTVVLIDFIIALALPSVLPGLQEVPAAVLDSLLVVMALYPVLYLAVLRPLALEIAERKRVEAEREQLIRELEVERQRREEFISVVAHDLRGALTPIRGYSDYLVRLATRESLPDGMERALTAIVANSRRLDRMIEDLLDVSRIEAHRLTIDKKLRDLPALVREIVLRSEELTKGHPVEVGVRGAVPPLEVDADRFEQVLTNLLSNAGKYSYPDSPILVDVEPRPGEVVVSVANLGPGLGAEDRQAVFTRFHRTRLAREEKVPGLGLGLYIAKGLVEAHGGRIWVESEPGKRTAFSFALPLS